MKALFRIFMALLMLLPCVCSAASSGESSAVAKALKKLEFFNADVNTEAKYYIYLQSASWCPYCRKGMPDIVSLYGDMKKNGVELALISRDNSKKDAKSFAKDYKMPFPIHFPKQAGKVDLPGFETSNSVPYATIVTADGRVVVSGNGSLILNYKWYIENVKLQEPDSTPSRSSGACESDSSPSCSSGESSPRTESCSGKTCNRTTLSVKGLCSQTKGKGRTSTQEDEVFEAETPDAACEYILERAVICEPSITLKFASSISQEDREKAINVIELYGFGKVFAKACGSTYTITPLYTSVLRMLKHLRDPDSIELTRTELRALEVAAGILQDLHKESDSFADAASALHDWIVGKCSYDKRNEGSCSGSLNESQYNAHDGKFMFLDRKGVYDSYATAYWMLLQMAGVPNCVITGKTQGDKNHAWNLVKLGNDWGHVDTACDDPTPDEKDRVFRDYFNKSDYDMIASREWEQDFFPNAAPHQLFSTRGGQFIVFKTVKEFVNYFKELEVQAEMDIDVLITELQGEKNYDQLVQMACDYAGRRRTTTGASGGVKGTVSCAQDPLLPKAIRVRCRVESE